jgi:uncharacterized protein YndB with AHSA1/START domain
VFQVIDRPRYIVLTTTETRLDGSSFDTELEFTFQEQDGKTLMTMVHSGFPSVELRDEHRVGLPNAFARLERAVSADSRHRARASTHGRSRRSSSS